MTQLIERPTTTKPRRPQSPTPAIERSPLPRRTNSAPAALQWQDVKLPGGGRARAWAWLPTILIAGCAVALVYLVQTSGVATTGYDIQRLELEKKEWALRNEQIRLELSKRQSLTWVESEAIGRLGMVKAAPAPFLRANPGQ